MDKKIYEVPEVKMIEFCVADVITASTDEEGWGGGRG